MRAVDDINDKTTPGYKGIEPINHVIAFITLFINQGSDILNTVHAPINLLFKAPSQIYLLHQTKTKMITLFSNDYTTALSHELRQSLPIQTSFFLVFVYTIRIFLF